ncbi:MAG: HEAT repeat domain-containing protein [Planctomycetota bacterium]|jgi:hypothetical protein
MKLSLQLKLGVFVIILFAFVTAACLLWRPIKYGVLKSRLASDDASVRKKAIASVLLDGKRAIPYLRQYLKSDSDILIASACSVLEKTDEYYWQYCMPELDEALNHSDPNARNAVARLLDRKEYKWPEYFKSSRSGLRNMCSYYLDRLHNRKIPFVLRSAGSGTGSKPSEQEELGRLSRRFIKYLMPDYDEKRYMFSGGGIWYIWRVRIRNKKRIVLFDAKPTNMIPGASKAVIWVFNEFGKTVATSHIFVGYRTFLDNAGLIEEGFDGLPVVEVKSSPGPMGHNAASQFYTFLGDKTVLARLHYPDGTLMRNFYTSSRYIGPRLPERTADEWEEALMSDDPVEQIRTLAWLGGTHLGPRGRMRENDKDFYKEAIKLAYMVTDLLGRESVKKRLKELLGAENEWIKDAANLALDPKFYR